MSEVSKEQFPPLMRRPKAAEYVREVHFQPLEVSTLATMATRGGGPPYHRIGNTVLYPRDELDAWALERLGRSVSSTSALKLQARAPEPRRDPRRVLTSEPVSP
jgi:hypothetical protein